MNVADKKTFFTDIANRLRPGGRLAIFEVCRSGSHEPPLPLPWSMDGSDSHLSTPDNLLATIQDCGFEISEWVDDTPWTMEWFHALGVRMDAAQTAATLPALLADGPTRMLNYVSQPSATAPFPSTAAPSCSGTPGPARHTHRVRAVSTTPLMHR